MAHAPLESIKIQPASPPKASIIWLHGLGADGHDFAGIAPQLNLPEQPPVRFIFPHAPVQPVTINASQCMRAWYDIYSLTDLENEDQEGINRAKASIFQLIEQEIEAGIPVENIYLAGFSQGGALALYAGLRYPKKLGGIIALSTYLPLLENIQHEVSPANSNTAIFMAHGHSDPVLPLALGNNTYNHLKSLGFSIEWNAYPMAHQVCPQEINAIGKWLCRAL
jgi:phospholipase/carboxylesterase